MTKDTKTKVILALGFPFRFLVFLAVVISMGLFLLFLGIVERIFIAPESWTVLGIRQMTKDMWTYAVTSKSPKYVKGEI